MVNFMVYELYISKAIEVTKEKERKEGRRERKGGDREPSHTVDST